VRTNWLPIAVLAGVLTAGSWARLGGLGRADFSHDELLHWFAAQALTRGEGPVLPNGAEYRRGIDLTRLVSVSSRYLRDPERAARLPSAVFGVLNLVLFAALAWIIAGPWGAVWATTLLAIYPEAVWQSRTTRFYTYQLVFGLIALHAGWHTVKAAGARVLPAVRDTNRQWGWATIAITALALGARVQVTTLSVALGWMTCVGLAAIADLRIHGPRCWRRSVPVGLVVGFIAAGIVIVLAAPAKITHLVQSAFFTPLWATLPHAGGGRLTYYHALADAFPIVISLGPVIFLLVAHINWRLSAYLLTWFLIPVALHSVVFPFKGERFVLLAVPALLLAAAIATATAAELLVGWITRTLSPLRLRQAWSGIVGPVGASVVAAFAVITTPAFNVARKAPQGASAPTEKREDWRTVGRIVDSVIATHPLPVGTSNPWASAYYSVPALFDTGLGHGDGTSAPTTSSPRPTRAVDYRGAPISLLRLPVLATPEQIRQRFGADRAVLLAIDSVRWQYGSTDAELRRTLQRHGRELCDSRCGSVLVFYWPLHD